MRSKSGFLNSFKFRVLKSASLDAPRALPGRSRGTPGARRGRTRSSLSTPWTSRVPQEGPGSDLGSKFEGYSLEIRSKFNRNLIAIASKFDQDSGIKVWTKPRSRLDRSSITIRQWSEFLIEIGDRISWSNLLIEFLDQISWSNFLIVIPFLQILLHSANGYWRVLASTYIYI